MALSLRSRLRRRARLILRRLRWKAFHRRGAGAAPSVRLHLGCGQDYWTGYVNIDVSLDAESDLCLDFSRIGEWFAESSVAEAVMIHSIAYGRLWEARRLLRDLHRVLVAGGRLVIETPDLAKCAAQALDAKDDLPRYLEAVRGLYAFDMEYIEREEPFVPYAFGWSAWHLREELEKAGFREVQVLDPRTHGPRVWRDTRIEAVK
jgi:SAM-dependent methyltransferase